MPDTMPDATALERRRSTLDLVCPTCRNALTVSGEGYRCVGCGNTFPAVGGFPDLTCGDRYEDAGDEEQLSYEEQSNTDLTRNYWRPLFRTLWTRPQKAPRLLSVGCGTGVDVDLLHDYGFDSVGIDCGNRSLAWPRRTHPERLVLANGKHLPFQDAGFDAVFCGCVFPHVGVIGDSTTTAPDVHEQRVALANEMVRVLRPGGYVIVSSPNRRFPFDLFHCRKPGHYRPPFNPRSSQFLLSVGDYERMFMRAGCGSATTLPVENYWGFIRSRQSLKGLIFGIPLRFLFWLISRPVMGGIRGSSISPWLVVMFQKAH